MNKKMVLFFALVSVGGVVFGSEKVDPFFEAYKEKNFFYQFENVNLVMYPGTPSCVLHDPKYLNETIERASDGQVLQRSFDRVVDKIVTTNGFVTYRLIQKVYFYTNTVSTPSILTANENGKASSQGEEDGKIIFDRLKNLYNN